MPKSRKEKELELERLTDRLTRMKSVVFSTTAGLKVADVTKLRRTMREQGAEYLVVKKSLLSRAFAASGVEYPALDEIADGFSLSFGLDDEVTPAKLLAAFRKEHEAVALLGGVVGGVAYTAEQVVALAKVPSRQELLAKLVGTLQAPLAGFVRVAAAPLQGFVQVLKAKSEAV